jgi:hypothetical protein
MWRRHVVYESQPRSVIVTLRGHLYIIPEVVPTIVPPKKCRKVVSHTTKFSFFTICSKGEQKDTATQPLQPHPRHLLSNKSRSTMLQQSAKIPSAHLPLMQLNLLNNLIFKRFMTDFHKLISVMSPTIQAAYPDADLANAFPSPPGTQRNGDHFFLRRED